jgi:uncharacterized protein YjbJ (UPF0337 family)
MFFKLKELVMNKNVMQGNWDVLKGKVKEMWGNLTDNDLTEINGKKDQLVGKLEKKYGYAKDEAQRKVDEFEKKHTGKV